MPPLPNNGLSRRERQIMDILFECEECSAQDVLAKLPDPPSYSTVRALLARLLEKKIVNFRMAGAKYIYFPVVGEEKARESAISRVVKTFFKGSRAKAVNALLDVDEGAISVAEIAELERTIARIKAAQAAKGGTQ